MKKLKVFFGIAFALVLTAFFGSFVYTFTVISSAAERTAWSGDIEPGSITVLIVLGMGPTSTNAIEDRSELAATVWKTIGARDVVTSGGQGADEIEPESKTLAKDLRVRGIPEEVIIEEPESRSTYENLLNSADILKRNGLGDQPVAIITHSFHAARVEAVAQSLGYDARVITANPGARIDRLRMRQVREVFALWKWWLLGH